MNIEKPGTQLSGIANLALLAPVRKGFIPGAEPFTYAKRLENFFKTLHAIRLGLRESTLHESPFPDAIGRWGILQSFRYALIPPEIGSTGEPAPAPGELVAGVYRLYLNVTFDGGWEPYMRVIYRDIGSLLDAIFCNCDDYPASARHSYDEYIAWVRSREIPAGIFYAESAKSVQDQRYLEHVERNLRDARDEDGKPAGVEVLREVARFALPAPKGIEASCAAFWAAPDAVRNETVDTNLRALKGLYDLRAYYADNEADDDQCLLRFAQEAMPEFGAVLPQLMPKLPQTVQRRAEPLVNWLLDDRQPIDKPKVQPPSRPDEEIQSGILSGYLDVTHGCLFLLEVTAAEKARAFLARLEPQVTSEERCAQQVALPGGVHYCNVAFTPHGLARLGVTELDLFPQEFLEGMEARAGLLGDVRGNHPDRWRRPTFEGREVDFASVHLVLQYRLKGDANDKSGDLHVALQEIGRSLREGDNGLRVLSAEPMRSFPEGNSLTREHFGFRDGFSQPKPGRADPATGAKPKWDDGVNPGELFLGHPNDRDDPPYPQARSALRDNGTFLVIRKLRQHVRAWNETLRAAASKRDPKFDGSDAAQQRAAMDALAAKLMGRDKDGNALANANPADGNDFDYAADPHGERCPFQSHVRRANPRTVLGPKARMPRLVRRGMSYGGRYQADEDPEVERGLYFMAYCGSIAEQFEIIQRWIAGGNSSGILAAHSDPLLGVPQSGMQRSFQWFDGADVQRIDLPDEPLTNLEWGLYLFVPSRTGLRELSKPPQPAQRAPAQRLSGGDYDPESAAFLVWREHISARENRDALWQRVNADGGDLQTPYGRLVSDPEKAFEILRDDGKRYSVCGYDRRFAGSVGEGFLGMDPAGGHQRLAIDSGVNAAIASITEELAFYAAREVATTMLQGLQIPSEGTNVDIAQFAEMVLARLCTRWFGLPDKKGEHMLPGANAVSIDATARCPRDFVLAARHIFGAHPTETESQKGRAQGDLIRNSVVAFLESPEWKQLPAGEAMLAKDIKRLLKDEPTDVVASTIAGVILGFAPSTHGNFVNLLRAWSERTADVTLWDLQTALLEARPSAEAGKGYETMRDTLRAPLIAQMRKEPIPATVWREKAGSTKPDDKTPEPEKIVIGLHGVMQHEGTHEMMMWGGVLGGFKPPDTMPELPGDIDLRTVHACPGYGMATGVLLGILSSVLLAGTLLSTPSPLILKIKP